MSSMAATPAIGLLIDAMRKMASRPMGSGSPKALCPMASTCTSSPPGHQGDQAGQAIVLAYVPRQDLVQRLG